MTRTRRSKVEVLPHLQEAVAQGWIRLLPGKLVIPAKFSPSKQELSRDYDRYVIVEGLSPEQFGKAAIALAGDPARAAELYNRQFDVVVKTPLRHKLVASARAPERALTKLAKSILDAGAAKTMAEALEKARKLRDS